MKILKMNLKVKYCEVIGSNLHIANSTYNPHKLPKGSQNKQK
jgi:hypothetical protein